MLDEATLEHAVRALDAGDLVVFPTETVYGIGCDALNPAALARLCAAKERPEEKGIAVILGDPGMLSQLTELPGGDVTRLAAHFWPGPLTLLVPSRDDLPHPIVRDGRTGCRVTSDATARALSARLGRPLASPSANPAAREPAHDVAAARAYFGDAVAVYLDDGPRHGTPSTLLDPGPPLRVLREGPITADAVAAVLR